MFGVAPIEKRLEDVQNILAACKNQFRTKYGALLDEEILAEMKNDVVTVNHLATAAGELKLLKDVRDGKLVVVHAEDGRPAKIAFI